MDCEVYRILQRRSPWHMECAIYSMIAKVHETLSGIEKIHVLTSKCTWPSMMDSLSFVTTRSKWTGLYSTYYGSPMFADDLNMLSPMKSGLDRMLLTAWEYSKKWRFTFNVKKTVILTFGENQVELNVNYHRRTWKLGSRFLSEKAHGRI